MAAWPGDDLGQKPQPKNPDLGPNGSGTYSKSVINIGVWWLPGLDDVDNRLPSSFLPANTRHIWLPKI